MQSWVARTMAMDIRDLMRPHTCEYGRYHFREILMAKLLRSVVSLRPNLLSVDTTKGVKWRR